MCSKGLVHKNVELKLSNTLTTLKLKQFKIKQVLEFHDH